LEAQLEGADFNTAEGALGFIDSLLASMSKHGEEVLTLHSQLRSGKSTADLYDLLYELEYLQPSYGLRWDGKPVEQLSPGEKGSLLLTFYLLADQSDTPLVIDQPEGNLDNETIYKTLVPAIRYAKHKRQIVLVTHNPNLAINCEADQVIYAEIDKEGGNRVEYKSGSIEDPWINKKIVDVLEGTRPAFDRRSRAYHPTKRRMPGDPDPDEKSTSA
jgi:ATPase subunit of ABC transporter with duplicated ATPase domains